MTMPLDPQAREFLDAIAEAGRPELPTLTPTEARAQANGLLRQLAGEPVPIQAVEDRHVATQGGDIPIRLYTPAAASPGAAPALLFAHGGGWVICDMDTHDNLCRKLANAAGCKVVSVDYRMAPEHKFPAALEDIVSVYRWLVDRHAELGIDPRRIALGGDSAGGNLAAAATRLLCHDRGPAPCFQLLVYPVTDLRMGTPSYRRLAEGYFLTAAGMAWFIGHYLASEGEKLDPRASPFLADDVAGLPPALILTAGYDVLSDEGRAYAERLRAAGVTVTHIDYPGMIHGFLLFPFSAREQAIDEAAAALAARFRG
jgi:acetyl esterase